jgi:conjugal transfer ATP-binding protein TraC
MLGKVISFFSSTLLGREKGGVTHAEIDDLHYRDKFSDFFSLYSYEPSDYTYHNSDGTVGWIWECSPLINASEKTLSTAEAFLRLPLPDLSVMQFALYADPDIKPFIDAYKKVRKDNDDPMAKEAVDNYCDFLIKCATGTSQMSGIPLRNFRLFVSLKIPADNKLDRHEVSSVIRETLSGMGLAPRYMSPPYLLDMFRRFFNDDFTNASGPDGIPLSFMYEDHIPINKQIILADTEISNIDKPYLIIGKKWLRSLTPKAYPKEVDPFQTRTLLGGLWGISCDNDQHQGPFLYSLNLIYDRSLRGIIQTKCDAVLNQEAAGSIARRLARTQEEYRWAVDKLQQGEAFARAMPVMWFIGKDKDSCDDAYSRGKRIWETEGYLMQDDRHISYALFLASLPMCIKSTKNNINMMERDKIANIGAILNIIPIQTDFAGCNEPVIVFQGRTGQICPISIFSKNAKNFNGFIAAPPGAGKSILGNSLAYAHYTAGAFVRIIDIGGSYARLCDKVGGVHIEFTPEKDICLNMFTTVINPEDDLSSISLIVLAMVFSGTDHPDISEIENTLAQDAVQHAWDLQGTNATLDDVRDFLEHYPDRGTNGKKATENIIQQAHHMAFNLAEFTTGGRYAKYFIGKASFNIKKDRFVLLELGELKNNPALFRVITMLVFDAVSRDLYFSDKKKRRLILFDESWQFLSGEGDNSVMKSMIESGFRQARKFGGGLFVITQSVLDRKQFGSIGDVIWNYSDYKFLLQSEDYEKALTEKLIEADPYKMRQLKSLRRNGSKFSEIYIQTPYGEGVGRLALDPFSYYLFTSDALEVSEMKEMVKGGATYQEAIHEMVRKYRSAA